MAKLTTVLGKSTETSSLETLIGKAAKIQAENDRLSTLDGALSPKAYLAAVSAMPGADKKQADTIHAAIAGGPPEGPVLASSVRRFVMALRQFKPNGPLKSKHLSIYIDAAADASLARLNCSRESLYLVAAQQLAETYPQLFGVQEKVGALQEQIDANNADLADLRAQVESLSLSIGTDLELLGETKDGMVRLCFTMTDCEVNFGADRFQHLLAWYRNHRQVKAAA